MRHKTINRVCHAILLLIVVIVCAMLYVSVQFFNSLQPAARSCVETNKIL